MAPDDVTGHQGHNHIYRVKFQPTFFHKSLKVRQRAFNDRSYFQTISPSLAVIA
jgi:hypothetical protein